ncbi:hypothetical protein J2S74_004172 [Evansella vedderi]|uniref:Uncharacterized protein n=1 Tax=Evansella vedderi TaxID=38282 RepID=A0ABU0A318_9BACI|nr:hypothetical protein [Evansella vedderi]MDQ0256750.1 hypothetical protein [Evansella vedderi]
MKKICFLGLIIGFSFLYNTTVFSEEGEKVRLEERILEWEEAGIDPNHTETIEEIRSYLERHIAPGIFASLHIDRDERDLGVIVLSFTEDISGETKREIEALVEEPSEVAFRVVKFTEEQLREKQREIDSTVFEQNVFESEGITVHHTSPDIINSKVEIGISPFNDGTAQFVYDYFGDEMINVVQGYEVQLLIREGKPAGDAVETEEAMTVTVAASNESTGFFTRIWNWFLGLFG